MTVVISYIVFTSLIREKCMRLHWATSIAWSWLALATALIQSRTSAKAAISAEEMAATFLDGVLIYMDKLTGKFLVRRPVHKVTIF